MTLDPQMFGHYDIRGIYQKNLTLKASEIIGKAVGAYYLNNNIKKLYLGQDNRQSGKHILKAFKTGFLSTGADLVNLKIIMTPMAYFAWHHLDAKASGSITASHNPAEYNGFKLTVNKRPMTGEDYQQILKIAQQKKFKNGQGQSSTQDIWPAYQKKIVSNIKIKRPVKLAIDTGNGTCGLFVPRLLKDLGLKPIQLFTKSDGSFPNHEPYPQKESIYTKLKQTLKTTDAEIGLAFDGDGDRVGLYDKKGRFIQNDVLAMLLIRDILKNHPKAKIVMGVSTSMAVIEDIKNHQGRPVFARTGYPWVTKKMKQVKAKFGGEISGHFFFKDRYYGFDDASYAALRIIELLSQSKKSINNLLTNVPRYLSTPEFRVSVPKDQDKFKVIQKIIKDLKNQFKQAEILDIDGLRFTFKDNSWGLIRASSTEPKLTGRAEAKDQKSLTTLKKLIQNKLYRHSQIKLDWSNPLEAKHD